VATLKTRDRSYQTNRERMEKELGQLEQIRRPVDEVNREICDHVLPGAARFLDENEDLRGGRDDLKIIDDAGIDANDIQAAGMMNGNTNQSEPWFEFGLEDPDLEDFHTVQEWLQRAVRIQMGVYSRSNTYQSFHKHFQHLGPFGHSASFLLDDDEFGIHNQMMPIGQFFLAADHRERINTCFRRFKMTIAQVVEKWGPDAVSGRTKRAYDRGDYHRRIEIVHVVEPRWVRDITKSDKKSMPWMSCYFERGIDERGKILGEGGFRRFPVIAPRFDVHAGDVYGFGPGRRALGAIKQLQQQQFDKSVALDKMVDPALQGDAILKGQEVNRDPGGFTYTNNEAGFIRPLHDVRIDYEHLLLENEDVRRRIHRAFGSDLWAMLARPQGGRDAQKTAREIAAMQTEQLAILAPRKARIDDEFLRPHVETTFERLFMAGKFGPPPAELLGKELTVRFKGILSIAQRMAGIATTNQFIGFAGNLLAMGFEEVRDRLDIDNIIDEYARRYSVSVRMTIPKERAQPVREARNKAIAAQQQAQQMPQLAKGAKDLAAAQAESRASA